MAFAAKNKKWLGYILYVILVMAALLYFLFPAQAVEELIDDSVSTMAPDFGFKAEKIRPGLPAGLQIKTGRIYRKDTGEIELIKADALYVGPRIMKLVRGERSFELSGSAYNGDINGSLNFKEGAAVDSELTFKDFDLAQYEYLTRRLKHKVTGKLSGDIVYSREAANTGNNGKFDLRLTDGQLLLQNQIFGIGSVDLQSIDLELELRSQQITVVRAELAGAEVRASMTGSIQLQPDIQRSQLNLKGTVEPLAEFYRKYPEVRELLKSMRKRVKRGQYFFAITGTLGEPRFRLL